MTADAKIKLIAENQASGTIKQVQKDIAALDKQAGTAAGGIGSLGKALGAAGLVAFGVQAGRAAIELAELGNASKSMRREFENLASSAGQSSDEILDAMKTASRGTITEFELMQNYNRAAILGVADTAQEMAALLEFSSRRARQLGTSLSSAFESLTLGIGRGSALILDNVGISLNDINAATEQYANQLGTTSDALTDAQKKQALLNAVMADNAKAMGDANQAAQTYAGEGMAALTAGWQDFRAAIGESIGSILDARSKEIDAFLQGATDSIRAQTEAASITAGTAAAGLDDPQSIVKVISGQVTAAILELDRLRKERDRLFNEGFANTAAMLPTATDAEIADIVGKNLAGTDAQIARLEAEINQLNVALYAAAQLAAPAAEEIAQAGEAAAQSAEPVNRFAESMRQASEIVNGLNFDKLFDTLLNDRPYGEAKEALAQIQAVLVEITGEWVRAGVPIEDISGVLLPKLLGELNDLTNGMLTGAITAEEAGQRIHDGFLAGVPGVEVLLGRILALGEATQAVGQYIRALERQASASSVFAGRGARTGAGDTGRLIGGAQADALTGRSKSLARPGPAVGDLVALGGFGGGGGTSAIDNTLNSIASRVKSVLQGSLKSGIDLDSILGRPDAIEEPARRLADLAVRGFESPWTDYIKNTFPEIWSEIESAGDPKQAAASILRQFEDGLRPELLDKGRAKDLVRAALLGEANTAQLANEIATELASELGISLAQAQQAAAGVLGSGATPDESGMNGAVVAAAFVDDFSGTITGMLSRFEGNGTAAGTSFQVGFLGVVQQGLPAGILSALASQLLPMLAAGFAAQGTRTGAN